MAMKSEDQLQLEHNQKVELEHIKAERDREYHKMRMEELNKILEIAQACKGDFQI